MSDSKEALIHVLKALEAIQSEIHGLRVAVVEFQHDEQARHERIEAQTVALHSRVKAVEQRFSALPCAQEVA
jgi:hypothetical protein